MPDALELPWMRRPIIPLVSAGDSVVNKLVAHRFPGLATVVGALDHLTEPAAALGCIQPIRIDRRSLKMKELPARKVRSGDIPVLAFAIGGEGGNTPRRAYGEVYGAYDFFFFVGGV